MVTRKALGWASGAALLLAAASCAQIFGLDRDYQQGTGGATGTGGRGTTTSSTSGTTSSTTTSSSTTGTTSSTTSSSTTGTTTSSTSGGGADAGADAGRQTCLVDTNCAVGNCCGGFCADLTTDPQNCGACNVVCPSASMTCSVTGCSDWAMWKMPNPAELADAGLPNPAHYDTTSMTGIVVDEVTGLWWQQPMDAKDTQNADCMAGCTQPQALAYCANLTIGTYSGWRLPTRIELVSILDFAQLGSTINQAAFPSTPPEYFWTSSLIPGSPGQAYDVYFLDATTEASDVGEPGRVRCVH